MAPGETILIEVGEVALLSYGSVTLGFPLAAPAGTLAVTLWRSAEEGLTLSLPPSLASKSTLLTPLRWRPVSWTVESVVALCIPPQVSMQTASLSSGGWPGLIPPPAAEAMPAPTDRQARAIAAGTAAADPAPPRLGMVVRALKSLSLSGLRG